MIQLIFFLFEFKVSIWFPFGIHRAHLCVLRLYSIFVWKVHGNYVCIFMNELHSEVHMKWWNHINCRHGDLNYTSVYFHSWKLNDEEAQCENGLKTIILDENKKKKNDYYYELVTANHIRQLQCTKHKVYGYAHIIISWSWRICSRNFTRFLLTPSSNHHHYLD